MSKMKEVIKYIVLTFFVGVSVINLYSIVKHTDRLLEGE